MTNYDKWLQEPYMAEDEHDCDPCVLCGKLHKSRGNGHCKECVDYREEMKIEPVQVRARR